VTRQSPQPDCRNQKAAARASRSDPLIKGVEFNGNHLTFGLSDGHRVAIHLLLYPKLVDASELQRKSWTLIGGGRGVRWSDIGENISVAGLLALQRARCLAGTLDC
jgi:hypothetical protein